MRYPKPLIALIQTLRKLPGVGRKTAERFAFQLLNWPDKELLQFSKVVSDLRLNLTHCNCCGCLIENLNCHFCDKTKRDSSIVCIVSQVKDVFMIEEMGLFNGMYHVMHGLISPIDGKMIDQEDLERLKNRLIELKAKEIVFALDSTVEGDATALFLKKQLENLGLFMSRLALGLPMGSSLDFVDEGTLSRAFAGRHSF